MPYKVKTFVPNPDPSLRRKLLSSVPQTYVTGDGTLVVPLTPNQQQSRDRYESEWTSAAIGSRQQRRLQVDPNVTLTHMVYDLPAILKHSPHLVLLEAVERGERGDYGQVVAGHGGRRMRPCRQTRCYQLDSDKHAVDTIFLNDKLSVMRLQATEVEQQFRLTIDRADVVSSDGYIVVANERFRNWTCSYTPGKAFRSKGGVPAEWALASAACSAVVSCSFVSCRGHFRLD